MATFTVDTLLDVTDATDGVTSLREALVLAAGSGGPDIVQFDPSLAGTITLTQGTLVADSDVAINGDVDGDGSPDVTIDANGTSRVISVIGAGTDVDLSGLVFTGGQASSGGALRAYSGTSVDITGSVITGNSASLEGGGIFNDDSTVSISASTISGNSAFRGGGIFAYSGSTQVQGSTISGNTASGDGGGIFNRFLSSVDVTNTSIVGNAAGSGSSNYGGGIANLFGTLTATHVTITGNSAGYGGGLGAYGTEVITNSVISGNTAAVADADVSGGLSSPATASVIGGVVADVFASIDGSTGGGQLTDNGGAGSDGSAESGCQQPGAGYRHDRLEPGCPRQCPRCGPAERQQRRHGGCGRGGTAALFRRAGGDHDRRCGRRV